VLDTIIVSFKTLSKSILDDKGDFKQEVSFRDIIIAKKILQDILNYYLIDEYQTFPSSFARLLYITNKVEIKQYHFSRLSYLVKFYSNSRVPSVKYFAEIIIAIYRLFALLDIPNDIVLDRAYDKLINNFDEQLNKEYTPIVDYNYDIHAEILQLDIEETRYHTPLLKIKAKDENSVDVITIYLWDKEPKPKYESHFSLLADFYFEGCRVNFFNLKYLAQKDAYIQSDDTFFTFMPDYLIDASAIAECYGNKILPENWLLKLFDSKNFSMAILQGKLVNQILDDMINKVDKSLEATTKEELTRDSLKILSLNDFDEKGLVDNITCNHLPNIYSLMQKYGAQTIITEPSFISIDYGIQGRLDGLVEDKKIQHNKSIFELKSGKAPNYNIWQNHMAQVVCYDLLLQSVYGKERTGYSMVFYSAAEKEPLRNALFGKREIKSIIMLRNQIVSNIYKIANNNLDFIELVQDRINSFASYQKPKVEELIKVFRQANNNEQLYFRTYVSYIIRQIIRNKMGDRDDVYDYGFSALWELDLADKEKLGTIFSGLSFLEKNDRVLSFQADLNKVSLIFREGDPALLYGVMVGYEKATATVLIRGSFLAFAGDTVSFEVTHDFVDLEYFKHFDYFVIEKNSSDFIEFSLINSLYDFLKAPLDKRDLLFGKVEPKTKYIENNDLIDKADKVIEKAMAAEDFFIIQGPPGTGKTSKVIIGLIDKMLKKDELPIVVLAFTNRAVNEIADKLRVNGFEYIRLGSRFINDANHISKYLDYNDKEKSLLKLKEKRLFISTVSTFQNEGSYLLQLLPKGTLIVDEASQLLEPHLAGLCVNFNKWILIGDHYQLPAVASSTDNEAPIELVNEIGLCRLNDSLFERMIRICQKNNWAHAWDILTTHYRMHNDIANLINHYYGNQLISGIQRQRDAKWHSLSDDSISDIGKNRTVFIDCNSSSKSKTNQREAQLIVSIVENYKKAGLLEEKSIGIICFWKAQCNLVQRKLSSAGLNHDIVVDTVERFQGSEKDIIILSSALSRIEELNIISLETFDKLVDRKLNVAVSRAKDQFILIGNKKILSKSSHYASLLSKLKHIVI